MLNFIDVEQNTDEWFSLRAGRLTSSKLGCVMANYPKAFGDTAKKYAVGIALRQITGQSIEQCYTNAHMDRGHEQEPVAREIYENTFFCDVANGGFFCDEFLGCSPDGLVGDNGVIEIKSVIASTHYATVKRGNIDPAYKWQVYGNLMFTGRDWIDFVSYCSDFPPDKQLFVKRVNKEDLTEEFSIIKARIKEFKKLVSDSKELILNSDYFK
jgi:hypothetical protein